MAAYFINKNGDQREWHVGGVREYPRIVDLMNIECVQADGDELTAIIHAVSVDSIPLAFEHEGTATRICSVQRWFGDTAKFIANAIWR